MRAAADEAGAAFRSIAQMLERVVIDLPSNLTGRKVAKIA